MLSRIGISYPGILNSCICFLNFKPYTINEFGLVSLLLVLCAGLRVLLIQKIQRKTMSAMTTIMSTVMIMITTTIMITSMNTNMVILFDTRT